MEEKQALSALSALAHETRLAVFRLLVRQGPAGMPAGEIAQRLNIPPATLSFHLKELERGGLIGATRHHRQIFYATDYAGTRELLDFLMRDCCQGHPEICGPTGTVACAVNAGRKETHLVTGCRSKGGSSALSVQGRCRGPTG